MALGFGFNKAKILASAEKFVQQGKLQNAITEYEKIVKEDPKDQTVLNTIGDLYARVGQNEHAAMYFKKVGDQYAQGGFAVKAIAIFKKLAKLQPGDAENTTKLAELYTQQGLYNDARSQYMHIAEGLLRSGDNNQAARIFQRILELDPENVHTQAKLADLYTKIGKKEEARNIFQSAAEALYARGSYEAAEEALGKVIALDPGNSKALLLRGMIAAGSGDHANAVRYLEQAPDLDSRPDALRALLQAKLQAGSADEADSIAAKLLNVHHDANGVTSLAEWYTDNNRAGNAVSLYEKNAERLFAAGSGVSKDLLHPLLNRVQDNPEALAAVTRLLGKSVDTAQTAEMMETEAHACAQKGDYARARDLYKKLSEMEPENALHGQSYKQMLAKLGEDSATRILSPEEAAQAFMVEELDQNATVVQQKYDAPTESAIEAALTDAELFVSYNVPSKAVPPLEAALPLAPKDITLNQRLATLYARAERWADAARMCENLSNIYRELGHPTDAARYQEAARKYQLRAPGPKTAAPARVMKEAAEIPTTVISPHLEPSPEPPPQSSVQEFSFDLPDPVLATEGAVESAPQVELQPEAAPALELQMERGPAEMQAAPEGTAPQEIDLSNEWEDMLSVESEAVQIADATPPAQRMELELEVAAAEPALEPAEVEAEPQGGSQVCYLPVEKVQEVEFYISQQMWQQARTALRELTEIAPDAREINELMAAIAAGQSKPAESKPAEAFASADFLPPPFAAPAPHVAIPVPAAQSAARDEQVLELEVEPTAPVRPPAAIPGPAPAQVRSAAAAPARKESTEDILSDFILDLEKTDLADFTPHPKSEPAPAQKTAGTPVHSMVRHGVENGELKDAESASVLKDILSELQEETATGAEPEEDPETHYNLGIAFKEMGLLDEAIGELQKVCRAVDQGQKFSQPIQAYTWLAQCLVDKGVPEAALRWYQKALQLPGLDDGSRCAIYYDLAAAHEASGDTKSALSNFMEVYGSNIDFRDVASRIKALKS